MKLHFVLLRLATWVYNAFYLVPVHWYCNWVFPKWLSLNSANSVNHHKMVTHIFTDEVVFPSEWLQGNTDIFVITTRIRSLREGNVLVMSVCLSVQKDPHVTTTVYDAMDPPPPPLRPIFCWQGRGWPSLKGFLLHPNFWLPFPPSVAHTLEKSFTLPREPFWNPVCKRLQKTNIPTLLCMRTLIGEQ